MTFLSPQIDLVFKKLFGSPANKGIVIDFLNSVLDRKEGHLITDVTFSDTNNHLKLLEQKFSIVDVRCSDQKNNSYIVEIQVKKQTEFAKRAQYYGACGLDMQLQPTERYKALMPVIFIGIVNFPLFERHQRYLSHHYLMDYDDHERDLSLLEFHFIELPKFTKTVEQLNGLVDKWIYFLKNAAALDDIPAQLESEKSLKEAFRVLTQSNWTRQELALYEKQVDARRVELDVLDTAREEGEQKGRNEERLLVARSMLAEGIDATVIAKVTGLAVDALKKLKK